MLEDCAVAHWLDGKAASGLCDSFDIDTDRELGVCGGASEDQNPVCKACHSTCQTCQVRLVYLLVCVQASDRCNRVLGATSALPALKRCILMRAYVFQVALPGTTSI